MLASVGKKYKIKEAKEQAKKDDSSKCAKNNPRKSKKKLQKP